MAAILLELIKVLISTKLYRRSLPQCINRTVSGLELAQREIDPELRHSTLSLLTLRTLPLLSHSFQHPQAHEDAVEIRTACFRGTSATQCPHQTSSTQPNSSEKSSHHRRSQHTRRQERCPDSTYTLYRHLQESRANAINFVRKTTNPSPAPSATKPSKPTSSTHHPTPSKPPKKS